MDLLMLMTYMIVLLIAAMVFVGVVIGIAFLFYKPNIIKELNAALLKHQSAMEKEKVLVHGTVNKLTAEVNSLTRR